MIFAPSAAYAAGQNPVVNATEFQQAAISAEEEESERSSGSSDIEWSDNKNDEYAGENRADRDSYKSY
jgi:hypothetical protein